MKWGCLWPLATFEGGILARGKWANVYLKPWMFDIQTEERDLSKIDLSQTVIRKTGEGSASEFVLVPKSDIEGE